MSKYPHQITMIVPMSDFAAANDLARMFGETPNEPDTFTAPSRIHNGIQYAWIQTPATERTGGLVSIVAAGGTVDVGSCQAFLDGCLVMTSPDQDWTGQAIIALDVPAESIFAAYGIEPMGDS